MGKYNQLFEDHEEMFTKLITNADLNRYMSVAVLSNNTAKKLYTITKPNDLHTYRSGDDVIIIINEKIFEKLPPEQQLIAAESAVSFISFDTDKDKIVITKPDFEAHRKMLKQYSFEIIDSFEEAVKSLYQAEKDAEDAAKAITSKGKKSKNKYK
jgi:hypothetical protein